MKETITENDIGQLSITEDETDIRHVRKDNKEIGLDLEEFKKLVKVDQKPKCNSDMIKCSSCRMNMGIKKWARLATKKILTCPACGATAKVGTTVKVVLKKPSRFKIENIESGKSSVETRPDGTKLYKEEVHVSVSPVTAQKKK